MTTDAIDKLLGLVEHNVKLQKSQGWKDARNLTKAIKLEIVEIEDFVHEQLEERRRLISDVEFYKTLNSQTLRECTLEHEELRELKNKFAELWKQNAELRAENHTLKLQFKELYLENLKGTTQEDDT